MIMLMRGETLIKDFSKWNNQKKEEKENSEPTPGKGVTWNKNSGTLTISYNKRSITMQDKNLGAIEAGVGEKSIGHLFVWGINKGFYFDDSKNSTGFLVAKEGTWNEGAKGPCPKGYHIPTKAEWQAVIDLWKNNNPKMSEQGMGKKFSEDLLLPAIGTRQEAAWRAEGNKELGEPHQAYYWVSTPNRISIGTAGEGNTHLYLSFDTKPIFGGSGAPEIGSAYANGNIEVAIRCFQGEPAIKSSSTIPSSSSSESSSEKKSSSIIRTPAKEDSIKAKFSFYF